MGDEFFKGIQVDIRTGLPREWVQSERETLEEGKLENDVSIGLTLEHRLASEEGKFFVGTVLERLERRIDDLVNNDPEASALLSLFNTLGGEIQAGRAASTRLARTRLKRQSNVLPTE